VISLKKAEEDFLELNRFYVSAYGAMPLPDAPAGAFPGAGRFALQSSLAGWADKSQDCGHHAGKVTH
jgi:hypothetical protein